MEAVARMADYLTAKIDLPTEEWCKGRPGATLSGLTADLDSVPPETKNKTVVLVPVWSYWSTVTVEAQEF